MFSIFKQTQISTQSSAEQIDWNAPTVINKEYIDKLKEKMSKTYPDMPKYSWDRPKYPEEDLKLAYVKNTNKNNTYQRYNPFNLRLPYCLEGYERLYQHTKISDYSGSRLTRIRASTDYFEFLRQYNLAYITYLEAINQSDDAITLMKELFSTDKMFTDARIKIDYLIEDMRDRKRSTFLLALLAYLTLNILYSNEEHISTAARVRALEFLRKHFDVEKAAAAYKEFSLGYYPYDETSEPVYDLLPKNFISEPHERSNPHNRIFLKNKKVKDIFKIKEQEYGHPSYDLDSGFAMLISKYPQETIQVLHSLLRQPSNSPINNQNNINLIFLTLINLSELDIFQKGDIFGSTASFRNDGISKPGLSNRAAWATGHQDFGDDIKYREELGRLSKEELITRLMQAHHTIASLEEERVESELRFFKQNTPENDPKGYFATLALRPDTSDEIFEEILKRNYRVLSLKYHPDKEGGTKEQFQKLEEAYRVLSDPKQRDAYREQTNNQSFNFRR